MNLSTSTMPYTNLTGKKEQLQNDFDKSSLVDFNQISGELSNFSLPNFWSQCEPQDLIES